MKYQQFLQYSYDLLNTDDRKRLNASAAELEIIKDCFEKTIWFNSYPPNVASRCWNYYKQNKSIYEI